MLWVYSYFNVTARGTCRYHRVLNGQVRLYMGGSEHVLRTTYLLYEIEHTEHPLQNIQVHGSWNTRFRMLPNRPDTRLDSTCTSLHIFLPSSQINHPVHLSVNTSSNTSLNKLNNEVNGFDPDGDHPSWV